MDTTNPDVVADVAALAASSAVAAERADAVIETVIEAAQERVEDAEENAQRIAEAAMEGERGRRIAGLEEGFNRCQNEIAELRSQSAELLSQMAQLREQVAAANTLSLTTLQPQALPSSNPPQLEAVQEAIADVETILPNNLPSDAAESPAPALPAKHRRWI